MPPLTVVVPMYIYPLPSAWDPLLQAAKENPHVTFLCIVNPNNGPGKETLPDTSYQNALTQLCMMPNIQTIGYVYCTYAERDMGLVKADIDRYVAWERESGGAFRINGIFIDEAPSQLCHREYMATLARHIRSACKSAPANHTGVVIYNPGVVVNRGFLEDADWVVVFEESHQHWSTTFLQQGLDQIPRHLRHKTVAMIHSFGAADKSISEAAKPRESNRWPFRRRAPTPASSMTLSPRSLFGDARAAGTVVEQMRRLGFGGLYITEQIGGGYNHWPATWNAMARSIEAGQYTN